MKKNQEQVSLSKLVFTQNWEDPESDHAALRIQPNESVMAITSGGCNVLGFLLFDPAVIYSVDINSAQSFILELKIAALKTLEHEAFIGFSGLKDYPQRLLLYDQEKLQLSPPAREYWDKQASLIEAGFLMNGKYERFIKGAGKFIGLLQGKNRVRELLTIKTKEAQQKFFDEVWNTRRFHYLFKILFNKWILARRGLVSDYFHFDDGSKSFADSFFNRSLKVFRNIPVKGNYFLHLYLTGRYRDTDEVPSYLQKQHYEVIKERVNRIQIITAEAQHWIDTMQNDSIDCFALSNICELMSEQETQRLFTAVYRTAKKDARIIFRNLMIPREVPHHLEIHLPKNEVLSRRLLDTDRSFVYGKVAAYTVRKEP
ncbi:MAG: DUF3419 family protein [Ferruginibacter sp.]|nr:DUF3419 family protein [Ferruginibacter sp.]